VIGVPAGEVTGVEVLEQAREVLAKVDELVI
jgi:hypothetical protein